MPSEATSDTRQCPIVELDEVDSTNAEALRRAAAGEEGPLWLSARRQTAGRGRSGRAWQSLDGNLAATLLFRPGCPPETLHQLSLLTGIAVCDAARAFHDAGGPDADRPRLKWPNDILAGGAKLAGILIESTSIGGKPIAAVGIGVNVAAAPRIAGRETIALANWGGPPTATEVLGAIDVQMRRWLDRWQCGVRFDIIRAAWIERAGPYGEPVSIVSGAKTFNGAYAGLDETGAFLVRSVPPASNELSRFTHGDVSLQPTHQREG